MYYFYLGNLVLPITPPAVNISHSNQNKTITLINEGEVNVLKNSKLTDISFEFMIPSQKYAFSATPYLGQKTYIDTLKRLKTEKKPFQFIIVRFKPNGKISFYTNVKVSLEDYTLKEDANNGFDVIATVKLKEYKKYGTKIIVTNAENKATLQDVRDTSNAPMPMNPTPYIVKSGDSLWAIAKKYYGDGAKYKAIAEANNIKNPNLIYPKQDLILPKL